MRKPTRWVQNRSDTHRAVQALKTAKGLESRGIVLAVNADLLRNYCESVLFSHMCNVGFLKVWLKSDRASQIKPLKEIRA